MRCLLCGKDYLKDGSLYDMLLNEDQLCRSCRQAWIRCRKKVTLEQFRVHSLWTYNEAFAKALFQYKECHDEALAAIFLASFAQRLHFRYRGYTLLLMPSTQAKQEERGFDHLAKMFSSLRLPMLSPFYKSDPSVQKEKTWRQRQQMITHIQRNFGIPLPKKILLCDDVMTTGATLKGALRTLDTNQHCIRILTAAVVFKRDLPGS